MFCLRNSVVSRVAVNNYHLIVFNSLVGNIGEKDRQSLFFIQDRDDNGKENRICFGHALNIQQGNSAMQRFARIEIMKLIVGLGNPGSEYQLTRHNAGYLAIDRLLDKLDKRKKFSTAKKFSALMCRIGESILLKPTTYMNESGRAVRAVMDFYKLKPEDLVVIHDDLDIKLGEYKVQEGVGPKIHNGVSSVEKYVGSKEFVRVRLGVDDREEGKNYGSGADYVLSKLSKDELDKLNIAIDLALGDLAITLGLEFI